eukprot:6207812-Pleurochrysis_carterae.AAC.1
MRMTRSGVASVPPPSTSVVSRSPPFLACLQLYNTILEAAMEQVPLPSQSIVSPAQRLSLILSQHLFLPWPSLLPAFFSRQLCMPLPHNKRSVARLKYSLHLDVHGPVLGLLDEHEACTIHITVALASRA